MNPRCLPAGMMEGSAADCRSVKDKDLTEKWHLGGGEAPEGGSRGSAFGCGGGRSAGGAGASVSPPLRLELAGLLGVLPEPRVAGREALWRRSQLMLKARRFLRLRVYAFCGFARSLVEDEEVTSARLVNDLDFPA